MQRRLSLLFAALLLAGTHAPAAAQRTDAEWLENCRERRWSRDGDRRVTHCEARPYQMSAQGRSLVVDGGQNGAVAVRGWDGSDVRVSARIQVQARTDEQAREIARQVRVRAADGRVSAEGPARSEGTSWSVSYEIQVPRRMDLEVETHNGPVAVSDVSGRMRLRTQNGPLALSRVGGSVNARATNGPLSVALAGDRWQGEGLDAETTNGPVTLNLPERYSAELEVGTTRGPVSMDIPGHEEPRNGGRRGYRSGGRVRTTLGSGGAPVRVVTTNGPVVVRTGRR